MELLCVVGTSFVYFLAGRSTFNEGLAEVRTLQSICSTAWRTSRFKVDRVRTHNSQPSACWTNTFTLWDGGRPGGPKL